MSQLIDLDLDPDARTLRQFGFISLAGFGLLALLAWQEWLIFSFGLGAARPWLTAGFLAVGGLAALGSLIHPRANRPLYVGLALLSFPIGFVLSYVIMGALFYLLIAPVGLVFRLFGRDLMQRRFDPEATTYWVEARPPRPRESYFKQF